MSKKIFLVFTAVLMVFAFASSKAVAAEATTVYLELTKQTTSPYDPSPIRGRATFIDAAGKLATTFNNQPIADATLVISSQTFGDDVEVATESFTTAVGALNFNAAPLNIDLDSAWHEFALNYDNIPEVGNDTIRATLKSGTVTKTADMAVTVKGPMANCYVVRSGGIAESSMPEVLEPIPDPQNDKGFPRRAGANVPIDVFAAFGRDTDADDLLDDFRFTDQLPAGAENVSVSGGASASVVLVDGHKATTIQVTNLKLADTLADPDGNPATPVTADEQRAAMNAAFTNGTTFTWSAKSSVIPEIGTNCGDVNGDDQLNLCNAAVFGVCSSNTVNISGVDIAINQDKSKFFPDTIQRVNMVGLPVTSVTNEGATQGFLDTGEVSPLDAIYYLADWTSKPSNFKVNGDLSGNDKVFGALVGFDAYKNLAPFKEGATANFTLLATSAPIIAADGIFGNITSGTVIDGVYNVNFTAVQNSAFLPFALDNTGLGVWATSADLPLSAMNSINEQAKGVLFGIENNAVAMPTTGVFPTVSSAVAEDAITITVTGTTNENSFDLRVVTQGGNPVGVNKDGATESAASVSIPKKKDQFAEQKIAFFKSLKNQILHYIFTGDSKKAIFAYKATVPANVEPADAGDFSPSNVTCSVTKAAAILDTDHDEITTCAFSVIDKFNNSYNYNNGATIIEIEDSDATAAIFKADGVTPFPGASAEIDGNNVVTKFTVDSIPAGEGSAILQVTAGDNKTAKMTLNIRALQQTLLAAQFVPIDGINNTPVVLSFGDQDGKPISPVILKETAPDVCVVGSFDVDVEAKDGSYTTLGDTQPLTTDEPSIAFTAKPDTGKTLMTITADGGDADATETTLTLDFIADFEPPVIGTLTATSCGFTIACTDNKALNLAGSTVVVKKSTGEDITSTVTRTDNGDGTASGTIQISGLSEADSYTVAIVLKDKANNEAKADRNISVTDVADCGAKCVSVDPAFGDPGKTFDVTITGTNTNFSDTSVVAFGCTGVTVNSVNATSQTTIVANITIAADAPNGTCDVTVDDVTCKDAFSVGPPPPTLTCLTVSPATGEAGTDVTVTITGEGFDPAEDVTVTFGCAGITVNSATVNSETQVTAKISIAAGAAACTAGAVTVEQKEKVTCDGTFGVTPPPECTISVSPTTVKTGFFLGRNVTFTITGSNCDFDASTTVEITGMRNVKITAVTANSITVTARTNPVILGGKGAKTMTVTTGGESKTQTITVQGLI